MEQVRQSVHTNVERYTHRGELQPHQVEHLRRVIAEASRTAEQPIELHVHLPVDPVQAQAPPKQHRDIDWVSIAYIGSVALVLILAMLFIFVGCMSQPPPTPPPVVHKSTPSCLFLC